MEFEKLMEVHKRIWEHEESELGAEAVSLHPDPVRPNSQTLIRKKNQALESIHVSFYDFLDVTGKKQFAKYLTALQGHSRSPVEMFLRKYWTLDFAHNPSANQRKEFDQLQEMMEWGARNSRRL